MEHRIVLAGDVMLARGIDQIQRHPGDPELREPATTDAREYVTLCERRSGAIPRNVDPCYVWGDTRDAIRAFDPDATVLNLETALTTSDDFDPLKAVHYRAHPANTAILQCVPKPLCTLANNHVLDLGPAGLAESLESLNRAGVPHCGAGRELGAARRPAASEPSARIPENERAVAVIGCCTPDAGVPPLWEATAGHRGVHLIRGLDATTVETLRSEANSARTAETAVVVSIHWGSNWGYEVGEEEREFAHALVDAGIADVVHGHSSHHPRPFEVYRGKPILYGCGDLINDYEGIGGHTAYRPELRLLYLVRFGGDDAGAASATTDSAGPRLELVPFESTRFKLRRADHEQAQWLARTVTRENQRVDGPALDYTGETIRIAPR